MASGRDKQARRIIQKVTVTYRLPGDPRERERTFTLSHTGDGAVVDGLIWNRALVEKLAYREDGKGYVDAQRKPSGKEWKSDMKRASDNCVWWHDSTCIWFEMCGPDEDEPV